MIKDLANELREIVMKHGLTHLSTGVYANGNLNGDYITLNVTNSGYNYNVIGHQKFEESLES